MLKNIRRIPRDLEGLFFLCQARPEPGGITAIHIIRILKPDGRKVQPPDICEVDLSDVHRNTLSQRIFARKREGAENDNDWATHLALEELFHLQDVHGFAISEGDALSVAHSCAYASAVGYHLGANGEDGGGIAKGAREGRLGAGGEAEDAAGGHGGEEERD